MSRAWGVLTADGLLEHVRRLAADPRFEPSLRQLGDLREVILAQFVTEEIRRLAGANPFGPGARRAIVAGANLVLGLARMYEHLADQSPETFRVFRDVDEAVRWLGLPEGWLAPPPDRADVIFGVTSEPRG